MSASAESLCGCVIFLLLTELTCRSAVASLPSPCGCSRTSAGTVGYPSEKPLHVAGLASPSVGLGSRKERSRSELQFPAAQAQGEHNGTSFWFCCTKLICSQTQIWGEGTSTPLLDEVLGSSHRIRARALTLIVPPWEASSATKIRVLRSIVSSKSAMQC